MGPTNSPPPRLTIYPLAVIQLGNFFFLLSAIARQGLQLLSVQGWNSSRNTSTRAHVAQQLKVEELSYSYSCLVLNQPFVLCSALPWWLLSPIIHF